MNLIASEVPIGEYLREAASRSPAPGGGAIAALVGAAAVTMGEMTAAFSVPQKRFAELTDDRRDRAEVARRLISELAPLRVRLLALADEDALAYSRVAAAWKLPKATDSEQRRRLDEIEQATRAALEVPLRGARESAAGLHLLAGAIDALNLNLISDAGVCAHGLLASVRAFGLNVLVNARTLAGEAAALPLRELATLEADSTHDADLILRVVMSHLGPPKE